jgi:16S rRNA (cytosine1407-C5)-methyltransferase
MNIATTSFPGEKFGAWFPERFDRVLLDAPCSMENLRSSETHPMRPISERERQGLAHRQSRLLVSALQAVRCGGEVVYATCTLSPSEDEAVLDYVLNLFPHAVQIKSTSDRLSSISAPALTTGGDHPFNPEVTRALRLWPHRYGTSGFFSALLTKTDSIAEGDEPAPQRPFAATGLARLQGKDLAHWLDDLGEQYGFDLAPLLAAQRLGIWRRGSLFFAIADAFIEHFGGLPYQSLGLLIGEDTPQGFEPSHEFVARCGAGFIRRRLTLTDDLIPAWLSGLDIRPAPAVDAAKGSMVIVYDRQGRLLSRGRILGDRIKNLLPKRNF